MPAALIFRAALLLALCLPLAGTVHAHAVVVETVPDDGAVVPAAPDRVTVRFNEPVSLIAARLLDAGGRDVTPPNATRVKDGEVGMALPRAIVHGTYVFSYRVVSVDGHAVGGSLVFSIGEATPGTRGFDLLQNDNTWRLIWVAVRAALAASLLASAGGVFFLVLVARRGEAAHTSAMIATRFAMLGCVAAILFVGVQGGVLAGAPLGGIASPTNWRVGFASTFGVSATVAFAGLALVAVGGLLKPSPAGRILAVSGALVALLSFALAGHVVTAGPRWLSAPALVAHTCAVAFWIGSLLPLRAALAKDGAATIVRRFSVIAVADVVLLVAAGVVIAALQVRGFVALVATTYGWLLLGKIALVGVLLAFAAFNKLRLTPALALTGAQAERALRVTIAVEMALAMAILLVTAALGTTPPPRALDEGQTRAHEHHMADTHHAHGLSVEMSGADRRVTLTFATAESGANNIEIAIFDEVGHPAEAREVTFTASNPAAGVEPVRRTAVAVRPGVWVVRDLPLVPAGEWSIRVDALVGDFEKPMFETTVELH